MKTILFIIQKEFIQVFRNRTMIPIIFIIPFVQLIILVNAANLEMKNLDLVVVDQDFSGTSRTLVSRFTHSPFFRLTDYCTSDEQAMEYLKNNKADMVIHIPLHFERDLVKLNSARVQVLINAINGTVAGIGNAYITMIIADFNKDVILEWYPAQSNASQLGSIAINASFWYNPELNYKVFMVPAILTILITIIGMFLSGLNFVREKEMGTIEQINVTPIKKYQFIIGKLIPFWILALIELGVGLILGKLLFNIPIVGSVWLLYGMAMVYLISVLGVGLFISTVSETQQQAMFITFFVMIVSIMLSGVFTPIESMPNWAQQFDKLNPVAYFMRIVRMILLKGSSFHNFRNEFASLVVFGVAILGLAVWRYRKKS
jgi:ABC-2 type transport system permease protein